MDRELFASDGSFPGFSSETTNGVSSELRNFLTLGAVVEETQYSQFCAFGPTCLMSSVWMSSRPGALPFFNAVIPSSRLALGLKVV